MKKLLLSIGIGLMSLMSFGQNLISSDSDIGAPTTLAGIGDVQCMQQIGDYLYTGLWASSNVNVYDVSTPGSPTLVNTQSIESPFTASCSLLGMDYANGYLYVVSRYTDKLYVLDVTNPLSLVVLGEVAMPVNNGDIVVDGNYAYVATIDSGGPLTIVDVSNPAAPVIVSQTPFGQGAGPYYCFEVTKSGNFCFLNYYNNGGLYELKVVDVTNPAAPTLVNASAAGVSTIYGDFEVLGNALYFTYNNGGVQTLRTLDISAPATPVFSSDLPLSGTANSLSYDGQYLYAACQTSGAVGALTVLDVSTPLTPSMIAQSQSSTTVGVEDVWIVPGYAYMANTSSDNLLTFPLTTPCVIADQTITQADYSVICSADTVVTIGSEVGVNYYLRDDSDDSVIDGPIAGTGSNINLSTGNISTTTTFNVSAGNPVSTNALDLDGASYAYVNNNNPFINWNQVVVEAWINPSANNVLQTIAARRSNIGYEWQFDLAADGTLTGGIQAITTGYYNAHSTTTVPAGTWSHVAMVFDGVDLKVFLNGTDVTTSNSGTTPTGNQLWGSNLIATSMGSTTFSSGYNYFTGQMRDVRIWKDVTKTAADIANGMCGVDANASGLTLNHFYNNDLTDETANNYNALMTGTEAYVASSYDCSGGTCSLEMTDMVTITIDPIVDQTVNNASFSTICSADTTIEIGASQTGVDYYLRDDADDSVIDGPIAGTGGAINLTTGNISSTTTFNVYSSVGGENNGALNFDGTDDWVNLTQGPAQLDFPGTAPFTIESWVNPTTLGSQMQIFSRFNAGVQGQYWFAVDPTGKLNAGRTGGNPNVISSASLPVGVFSHVAVVYDGTDISLYINGVLDGTQIHGGATADNSFVCIGARFNSWARDQYFDGTIDEVRVWNLARTPLELQNNMNNCLSGSESGLVGYYKLNETSGTAASDQTTFNLTGTLTNMDPATDWITGNVLCEDCSLEMTDMLTITIDPIADQTLNEADWASCDAQADSLLTLNGSQTGVNYYLRDDADDSVIDGPITGNGGAINFNTGAIASTTTYNVFSEVGMQDQAIDLPSANDHVRFSSPFTAYGNEITVEAWVYNPGGLNSWAGQSTASSDNMATNVWLWHNGTWFVNDNGTWRNTTMPALPAGWTHVATVADGTSTRVYYNGALQTTGPGISSGILNNPASIIDLGHDSRFPAGTAGRNSNVSFDDFRVWDVARTPSEIASSMNSCLAGTEPNLVQYTEFVEGTGTTVAPVTGSSATVINPSTNWIIGAGACGGSGYCSLEMTDMLTVTINALPTVDAGTDFDVCDAPNNVTLTGAGTANTYAWDNGVTDAVAFTQAVGTVQYIVTGTITATGCENTDTVDVTVNALPVVTAGVDQIACTGSNVTLSGGGATSYLWTGGISDATAFPALNGLTTYTVTGTDGNGCQNTADVDVTGLDLPVVTADSVWNASCMDTLDGQVFITVTGGAPGYLYDWDYDGTGDNDDLEDQDGLGDGTYNVTVEDANGCLGTSSSIITEPAALVASIAGFTDPTACATPDGTIDAAVAGGTGPYTYDWDNDGTGDNDDTEDLAALLAGNYILVVVDDNGCLSTVSQSLSDPSGPVVTIDGFVNNPCFGDSLASIDAGITGGLAPYTIDWDNDGTGDNDDTEDLSLLGSGTYVIVVTDVNGCIGTNTQDIIDPAAVAVAPLFTDALCNGDSTGTAVLNATGGTGTLIEDWGTSNPTMLEAGWHFYTVTDDNGCVLADSTEIMEPTVLTAAQTVTDISCYGLTDGSIDVTPAGGTGPYDVVFEGTDTTTTYSNLSDGTYGYTVTDANGCSLDSSASIVEPAPLIVSMTVTHEQAGGDGAIDLTVSGGTPVITFDWDNDGTGDFDDTEDLSGLTDGTYIVVVQDGNGCTATETAEIKPAQLGLGDNEGLNFSIYPNPTNGIITITFEELSNNSMISITDLAGKIVYTNTITETTEQVDLTDFERGTYVVTVQSANESHVKRIVKM